MASRAAYHPSARAHLFCRTTAEDKLLQQQVQLSDRELDIIRRLQNAENPDADYDP